MPALNAYYDLAVKLLQPRPIPPSLLHANRSSKNVQFRLKQNTHLVVSLAKLHKLFYCFDTVVLNMLNIRKWAGSSVGEHCLHTAGVGGSIPLPPTM